MDTISTILQSSYSLAVWQDVYNYLVPGCRLFQSPTPIDEDSSLIDRILQVGEANLSDGKLLFFDIEVNQKVVLSRNRVALNNILAKWLTVGQYDAAIGIFHSKNHESYRFTFARKTVHFNEDGELVSERTSAKRYTYVLGPGKHTRTAQQRFERLHGITQVTLADVEEAFSVEALTKQFYHELFDWYQWASSDAMGVFYPNLAGADDAKQALQEHLIRLITRLIFVWFIKQKRLVPDELFKPEKIAAHLKDFIPDSPTQHNYYRCYLQNLFFATLNREIGERAFAKSTYPATKSDHGVSTLYRYADEFVSSEEEIQRMFSCIPYLNGGLFECLDRKDEAPSASAVYIDGFSRSKGNAARLPNCLFFNKEKGIFPLLERYNFTIEENSAMDQAVALDPELLGKVFENLLGAYNPETQQTARNDSGSFYTPREVVDYMVDESLIAYLKTNSGCEASLIEGLIREEEMPANLQNAPETCKELEDLLRNVRILDPACGSGAFPVGALNRIMAILRKLSNSGLDEYSTKMHLIEKCLYGVDIQNIAVQISKLRFFISLICEQTPNLNAPERNFDISPLPNLETRFVAANTLVNLQKNTSLELDMGDEDLKRYQDERYAISQKLICPPNRKVKKELQKRERELADLTSKRIMEISCHPNQNSIAGWEKEVEELLKRRQAVAEPDFQQMAPKPEQLTFFDEVKPQQKNLTYDANKAKRDAIDHEIKHLRIQIEKEMSKETNTDEKMRIAQKLSSWVSSDLNATADFFDPEWMFAIKGGFDIVIGNPPYIQLQNDGGKLANQYQNEGFETFERTGDIYCLFCERGWQLLKDNGHLCFITSNKWMRAGYGASMRTFLANKTNPELLVDFAGQKIFESATVDTNILLFAKGRDNEGKTLACIAKPGCRDDLSGFVRQHGTESAFTTGESWVILNPIEQSIKRKIEAVGIPLKNWDIKINRGILTGCNEAFIIDENKRKELIAQDPRSAEIIRPILRGRDIKRYGYEWAHLYLIATFPSRHYDIDDYPAVKGHLLTFDKQRLLEAGLKEIANSDILLHDFCRQRLEQCGQNIIINGNKVLIDGKAEKSRKKTGNKWFETQDQIGYWEDFSKQKIVWGNLGLSAGFASAPENMFVNAPCPMVTPFSQYLLTILNSRLGDWYIRHLGVTRNGGYFEYKPMFVEQLPVPILSISAQKEIERRLSICQNDRDKNEIVNEIYGLTKEEKIFIFNE